MAIEDESTEDLAAATPTPSTRDVRILAHGTSLGLMGALTREGLAALTMFSLAHLATREQFGMIQWSISCVVLLSVLGKGGFNIVASRFVAIHAAAGEKEKVKGDIYSSLLWTAAASLSLAALISLLAPWLMTRLLGKPEFAAPLRAFVWWVPSTCLIIIAVVAPLAIGSARPRVVVRDLLVPGVFLVTGTLAAWRWQSAVAVGWAYTFSALVGMGLAFYYLFRFFPELRKTRGVYNHGLLLATSVPLFLTDLAAVGLAQADVLVVGRLLPTAAQVGIYAAAAHLSLLAAMPLVALNQITAPLISRLHHQGKRLELQALLKTFTRLCLTCSLPLSAVLVGLAQPVMGLLGKDFVGGAWALAIASGGVLVNVATGSVGMALVMTGYQWLGFLTNLLSVGLLVGMVWWLTPLYGVTGAAVGLATAVTVANLARLAIVYRVLRVNPMSKAMLKSVVAAVVATGVAGGLSRMLGLTGHEGVLRLLPYLLGLAVLSFAIYGGLVLAMGVEPSDRQAAQMILHRLRGRGGGGRAAAPPGDEDDYGT